MDDHRRSVYISIRRGHPSFGQFGSQKATKWVPIGAIWEHFLGSGGNVKVMLPCKRELDF